MRVWQARHAVRNTLYLSHSSAHLPFQNTPVPGIMNRPRVIVADDYEPAHEIYRKALEPDFDVLATVTDGEAVIQAALENAPDVVVLDVSMPVLDGFAAARQLRRKLPSIKIVFLTMHGERAYVEEAIKLGAEGYVLKRATLTKLLEAIRAVLEGQTYFPDLNLANAKRASEGCAT